MNHSILFICLIEENNNRCILDITKEILIQSEYEIVHESIAGDIIGFCNGNRTLIIFDLIYKDLNLVNLNNFNFDIIVHTYNNDLTNSNIDKLIRNSKICILNADDGNLISLSNKLEDVIAITFGFNSKATLTISSYNLSPTITANLCLQRDLTPLSGEKIEPFEYNFELISENEADIYPLLAASTLSLVIGETILNKIPYKTMIINI